PIRKPALGLSALTCRRLHQRRLPGLCIHLNPPAGAIQHRDAALIVDLDGRRVRKRLLKGSVIMGYGQSTLADHIRVGYQLLFAPWRELVIAGQGSDEPPVWSQNLDAVVLLVGDVDLAILVHTDTAGAVKLADIPPRLPKAGQPPPVGCKLLDAVVAPVGHVH